MAPRKTSFQPPEDREEDAQIRGSRAEAVEKIDAQIISGKELLAKEVADKAGMDELSDEVERWNARNEQLLGVLFTNSALKSRYHRDGATVAVFSYLHETPVYKLLEMERESIKRRLNALRSVVGKIDLIPEASPAPTLVAATPAKEEVGKNVFIVHGRDTGKRDSVARFVQTLKLNPIILEEQASKGDTVIEKFERNAGTDVGFAVVLMTPDDIGGLAGKDTPDLQGRARQNIIFELGYFFGRLGRSRVAALYVAGTELPSDISGVVYISFDEEGVWKMRLAREMKAAGLAVDMNDVQ